MESMTREKAMEGLLDGLGADDFDDDLQEDDPPSRSSQHSIPNAPLQSTLSPHDHPAHSPIPEFIGFATARGATLPPPSKAAMQHALRLVSEVVEEDDGPEAKRRKLGDPGPSTSLFQSASSSTRASSSKAALDPVTNLFQNPSLIPRGPGAGPTTSTSLFQTGSGSAIPPPSKAAMAKVAALFNEPTPDQSADRGPSTSLFQTASGSRVPPPSREAFGLVAGIFDDSPPKFGDPGPSTSMFQTGSGAKIAPPSKSALSRVAALFDEPDTPSALTTLKPATQPSGSLFTTSSGKFVPPPSDASRATVFRLLGDDPKHDRLESSSRPSQSLFTTSTGKPVAAPSAAAQVALASLFTDEPSLTTTPARPSSEELRLPHSRPFHAPTHLSRTPLRSTMNNHADFNPPQPSASRFKKVDIKTPSRRLGMSSASTPVPVSGASKRRGFVTPFKVPQARGASSIRAPVAPAQISVPVEDHHQAVFNVEVPSGRLGMRDSYLKPQYFSDADFERFGVPYDVVQITPQNALEYVFDCDGQACGADSTLETLRTDGCRLASKAWIQNHWPLILWKLSGEIQAQPSLYPNLWSIEKVINQLKYRYEREYGQAQRALVRRIREQDSSASVPMVLCVSRIFQLLPKETSEETTEPAHSETCLEVTDGWYTINAQIDAPLKRAVERGVIQVGRKLAMVGVKLAAGGEGEDPLEGNTSCLILSANCCSLARWDARLGRQPHPFIASLCSLTVDGGVIALMDVRIERLFPKAYMNAGKGAGEAPWDEAEESRRSAAWKDKRENELSRLNGEASGEIEKAQQIYEALMSQAEGGGSGGSSGANDQELFEFLVDAANPMKVVNSLSAPVASRLLRYAQAHYETTINSRREDIERDIEGLCPTREIRNFRLVRVIDAQEGNREPGRRVGMINIWDCDQMSSDMIKDGARYVISNLLPGRSGDWAVPRINDTSRREVYLHTRRDTRWYPHPE